MEQQENGEYKLPGIDEVTMDKETETEITLGKNGPKVRIYPDPESESGLSADYLGQTVSLKEGSNLVGRLTECAITINIPTVSRHHANINVGDYEYSINDLSSTNGTFFAE